MALYAKSRKCVSEHQQQSLISEAAFFLQVCEKRTQQYSTSKLHPNAGQASPELSGLNNQIKGELR
jgi:hypothetical protein